MEKSRAMVLVSRTNIQRMAAKHASKTRNMEQFKVRIPEEERISGRLYDYHSGMAMGLASDEQKKKYGYGNVFKMSIAGCPHELIIHK